MKATVLIALLVVALWGSAFAQNCCDFTLLRKDTVLKKSSISVIEIPPGKQAVLKFEPIPVVITEIDNTDPKITYTGTWYNGATTAAGFSNNTMAYCNVIGNSFTFQFTGNRLEWMAERSANAGRVGVTIDTKPEEIVPLNIGTGVQVKGWDLTSGFHTVKIRVLDAKYIVSDGYRVFN